jgi:enterobactin synthetase component D
LGPLNPDRFDSAIPALLDWLRAWLPAGCGMAATAIGEHPASEFADEERLIAKAVAKRRHEFRAGRAAARQALAQVGCAPVAILATPQRDPIWPPAFLGSISHSERIALAIAAPCGLLQAMGVDLEDDPRLDEQLVSMVRRPDEAYQQAELARAGIDHAKLCFVAKEAVFKALFPRQRVALEFEQLRLVFNVPGRSFEVALRGGAGERFSALAGVGRFLCHSQMLAAAFVIPPPALTRAVQAP